MRNTWRNLFRRLAAASAVFVATAWSSAMCYATRAYDDASDPVYADGWQGRVVDAQGTAIVPSGDNGGFGFGEWNFTSLLTFGGFRYDYANTDFHAIDDGLQAGTHYSNPHNSIGRAWALGSSPTSAGVPRAGRSFTLGIGETLKVVFDNPTRRQFFKGYQINLNGGTGADRNICYDGVECVAGSGAVRKAGLTTFEYDTMGEWGLHDSADTDIGVFDTDTSAAGAVFTVERTGAETYIANLVSMGGADFGPEVRTFESAGVDVNWIEFTFFNGQTDTTPTLSERGTDLYIRSMEIFGGAPPILPGDYNSNGIVDAADYVVWRKDDGSQSGYDLWRTNFGRMAVNSSGASENAAVPEPATGVVLLALNMALLVCVPRR
jgi:hypothetical protein